MKRSRLTFWIFPLALVLLAGGCATNDHTPNPTSSSIPWRTPPRRRPARSP